MNLSNMKWLGVFLVISCGGSSTPPIDEIRCMEDPHEKTPGYGDVMCVPCKQVEHFGLCFCPVLSGERVYCGLDKRLVGALWFCEPNVEDECFDG